MVERLKKIEEMKQHFSVQSLFLRGVCCFLSLLLLLFFLLVEVNYHISSLLSLIALALTSEKEERRL